MVGLIGQFFIVTDPAVLHAMEGGAYLDAAALTSRVAFLVSLGTDLLGPIHSVRAGIYQPPRIYGPPSTTEDTTSISHTSDRARPTITCTQMHC